MTRSVEELLRSLSETGVQVWAEGGTLRYRTRPGVDQADRLRELSARKDEVKTFLEACDRGSDHLPSNIQRFWQDGVEASCSEEVCFVWRVRGPLDAQALARAASALVERHPILRPMEGTATIEVEKARSEREFHALAALSQLQWPKGWRRRSVPLRLVICEAAPRVRTLALLIWRSCLDAQSAAVVERDFITLYQCALTGFCALMPLDRTYKAFVRTAARRTAAGALSWSELAGDAKPSSLGAPEPDAAGGAGVVERRLDGLSSVVRRIAVRHGVTSKLVLFALMSGLIGHLSGEPQVVAATINDDRTADYRDVIGCFEAIEPWLMDARSDTTFQELFSRSSQAFLTGRKTTLSFTRSELRRHSRIGLRFADHSTQSLTWAAAATSLKSIDEGDEDWSGEGVAIFEAQASPWPLRPVMFAENLIEIVDRGDSLYVRSSQGPESNWPATLRLLDLLPTAIAEAESNPRGSIAEIARSAR